VGTVPGLTAARRRIRRSLGISRVEAWTRPSRVKQRLRFKLGLYSPTARVIRQAAKGNVPTTFGL
jgi:hypothetical protein